MKECCNHDCNQGRDCPNRNVVPITKPYFVKPHGDRFLVARFTGDPGSPTLSIIEDCRTARFAREVADNYNRDLMKSPTFRKYHGTEYNNQR